MANQDDIRLLENIYDKEAARVGNAGAMKIRFEGVIESVTPRNNLVADITLQEEKDGRTESGTILMDRSAGFWNRYVGKKVIITGRKQKDNPVILLTGVVIKEFEDAIAQYAGADGDKLNRIRNYLITLQDKSPDKYDYLYKICVGEDTAGISEPRFSDIKELELKYAILRRFYPEDKRAEIERDFHEYYAVIANSDKGIVRKALEALINYHYWDNPHKDLTMAQFRQGLSDRVIGCRDQIDQLTEVYGRMRNGSSNTTPRLILVTGPTGSGKDHLIESMVEVLNINYTTFRVKGLTDPYSIFGSSRVYENTSTGALGKKILNIGPFGGICYEGLDLMPEKIKGAISEVILEKYENEMLEVPFPTEGIFVFGTALTTDTVPREILDSAVIINMPKLNEEECLLVGRRMWTKALEEYGISENQILINDEAWRALCYKYIRSGNLHDIRNNLENVLLSCSEVLENKDTSSIHIDFLNLPTYFSKLKGIFTLRDSYAKDIATIREKLMLLEEWYPESVYRRMLELEGRYDNASESEKKYILSVLTGLANTVMRHKPKVNLDKVARGMDANHGGMTEVKNAILDELAAFFGNKDARFRPVLINSGPGFGKTTLIQDLAETLDIPFVPVHLDEKVDKSYFTGGVATVANASMGLLGKLTDEHVRSYYALLFLDELDKAGSFEIFHNLLEGDSFRDLYADVEYPLKLIVIATSNDLGRIPATLRDRFNVIRMNGGYSFKEKLDIAMNYTLPTVLKNQGMEEMAVSSEVMEFIIRNYACSNGIRDLVKALESIVKRAFRENRTSIDREYVVSCLGYTRLHIYDRFAGDGSRPGVARALAVAGNCGCSFSIEVVEDTHGTEKVDVTGMVKDSAAESVRYAMTVCRNLLGRDLGKIAIHFSDGSAPKDGASAGLTIAAAILSYEAGVPLGNVAFTGELTLSGEIQSVGVEEKLIMSEYVKPACTKVYIPYDNYMELKLNGRLAAFDIEIVPVRNISELAKALGLIN